MALAVGDQIADRYQLTKRIAVGGMGEVWESEDDRLGRTVAIKVLKPEIGSDPEFLERFRGEARIAASLNHRCIAGVHDYGEDVTPDGTPTAYIVMELVRGEPLSARLAAKGKLDPALTLDILEQAGKGLQAAHAHGFVHRDVKPGNILLADDGTVKLTDFGIAKAATSAPVTGSGMVMGTAHYIAPEQARGLTAGSASDVYSLAVVGYECLAGHRPFADDQPVNVAMMHINDPVPSLPEDVPENVRALIEAALVKDPKQRYEDGGEFAAAVAAVRRGLPAPMPGHVPPLSSLPAPGALPVTGTGTSDTSAPEPPDPERTAAVGMPAAGMASPGAGMPRPPMPPPGMQGMPQPGMRPPAMAPPGPRSPTGGVRPLRTPGRGGRSVLTLTFVLLTIAAVAIGVFVVRNAVRSDGESVRPQPRTPATVTAPAPTNRASPSTALAPNSVFVDAAGYTGRPVTDVQGELENGGLRPQARTVQGALPSAPDNCTVTAVSPSGAVPKGTAVTITCVQH
ncbi:serine/threonine-protein kinase [Pseudonocardia acaciae]|uniref:serine/threonine-protein kinase n=1 Tax=Pseudonocardia acaciae TaxID=551276 RepID=UPI00048C902D|nr:serine/threonine-protein kinase [Pseudonocardia acaciae]